jgi:hypothetical protein
MLTFLTLRQRSSFSTYISLVGGDIKASNFQLFLRYKIYNQLDLQMSLDNYRLSTSRLVAQYPQAGNFKRSTDCVQLSVINITPQLQGFEPTTFTCIKIIVSETMVLLVNSCLLIMYFLPFRLCFIYFFIKN